MLTESRQTSQKSLKMDWAGSEITVYDYFMYKLNIDNNTIAMSGFEYPLVHINNSFQNIDELTHHLEQTTVVPRGTFDHFCGLFQL